VIGERNVLHHPKQLAEAADWIEQQWRKSGYAVKRQTYSHYHHAEDTPDKIDFDRMSRVVRGLEKVTIESLPNSRAWAIG
jgi:hypothetical protein